MINISNSKSFPLDLSISHLIMATLNSRHFKLMFISPGSLKIAGCCRSVDQKDRSLILLPVVQLYMYCIKKWQRKVFIYPWVGSNVIARGSSRFSLIRTFLDVPFSLLTSILSVPVSVQYKFRATQSTATPSGCLTSLEIITSTSKQVHGEINCIF